METLVETNAQPAPNEENLADHLVQHTCHLYNQLQEAHNEARERIRQDQQRQQQRYDKTVHLQSYNVGDFILLHETARVKAHTDKLLPKWTGPYRVHTVLGKGVYRVESLTGELDPRPHNAKRLKPYHMRTEWEPRVIIDHVTPPLTADPPSSTK